MHFFVADSVAECIIVSKKNQIMEQDYREKLTSVEQLALLVEQKCNIGNAAWAVVYFLAALVLLPAVLILSTGTGMAIWAYLTEGLYEAEGYTGTTTLAINVFCTVLGWLVCCWWSLVLRLFYCHLICRPYHATRGLLTVGGALLAELSLFSIAILIISMDYCIYLAAVPVALMLLIGYFSLRKHK